MIFHILQEGVFKRLSCVPGNQAHRWISASKHRRADLWAISDIPTQSRTLLKVSCGVNKSPHVYSNIILRMRLTLLLFGEILDWLTLPHRFCTTVFLCRRFSITWDCLHTWRALSGPGARWLYAPKKFWPSRNVPTPFPNAHGCGEGWAAGYHSWWRTTGTMSQKGNKTPSF